jgi:hypothetical protein
MDSFELDGTELAVVDLQSALAPLEGIDETVQIAETSALSIKWDKSNGSWVTDLGECDVLHVTQFAARRIWAKWSQVVGQPEALGWGEAPEGCDSGYAVVMETEEFGIVTGQFFGITSRVISSAAKKFVREGGFTFAGNTPVKTKFGLFYNPKVQ